MTYRSSNTSLY